MDGISGNQLTHCLNYNTNVKYSTGFSFLLWAQNLSSDILKSDGVWKGLHN